MSISTTTNRVSYAGDGSTTVFPYNFLILANTDLEVIETVTATGVETIKTLTTHYTVSGAGTGSGNVTMVTAPASGTTLTIRRKMPRTQLVDYVENDSFPAATHEQALDKLTMIAQELDQSVKRALRQPEGDSVDIDYIPAKSQRADKYFGFDADGDPVAIGAPTSTALTTAFTETVLDDADGDAVMKTIIDDMTAETAPAVGDLVPISDVSANDSRKMTLENVLKVVNGLTEDTTPIPNVDFVLTYDVSAGSVKKVKPSNLTATDSIPGVVELATTAEIQTGSDTGRVITPAGLKGAIGFSKYSESLLHTIAPNAGVSFAHGLGIRPVFVYVYLECVTAELGYSVGDHIPVINFSYPATSGGATIVTDATYVKIFFDDTYVVMNISTLVASTITFEDWKVGFRAWV